MNNIINYEVNYKQAKEILLALVKNDIKQPFFLWGSPGIGKTTLAREIAREMGMDIVELYLSSFEKTDLIGIPYPDGKRTAYLIPKFYLDYKHVLFLDEFNLSSIDVLNVVQRLVHDKRIGDYILPSGSIIIAAGNPLKYRVHATKLSTAMINRFIHLYMKADFEDWKINFAFKNIHPDILSFLQQNPEHFNFEDWTKLPEDTPFPTPRSWHFASQVYAVFAQSAQGKNNEDNIDQIQIAVAGAVGPQAAAQFVAFLKTREKWPNVDLILEKGVADKKITRDIAYSVIVSCITKIAQNFSDQRVENFLKVIDAEADKDLVVFTMKQLAQLGLHTLTPQYVKLMTKYREYII